MVNKAGFLLLWSLMEDLFILIDVVAKSTQEISTRFNEVKSV